MMVRRGKVSYLFDKYSESLRINAILFCQNMDKPESELGEVLNNWICKNIGKLQNGVQNISVPSTIHLLSS